MTKFEAGPVQVLAFRRDYARGRGNTEFANLAADSARRFFLGDKNCPLNYEPSGEDFLSPCLGEADMMRRVLSQREFTSWLKDFCRKFRQRRRTGLRPAWAGQGAKRRR